MKDSKTAKDIALEQKKRVTIHYIKANQFRVIHADGALGGVSPNGQAIHMSLFNERLPIPLQVAHELTEKGKLGQVIETTTRKGLVREVEADIIVGLETAKHISDWLLARLDEASKLTKKRKGKKA